MDKLRLRVAMPASLLAELVAPYRSICFVTQSKLRPCPMNIRFSQAPTPAARLAAVIREYLINRCPEYPHTPDYADIEQFLSPYLERELLMRAIAENIPISNRAKSLKVDLENVELRISKMSI